MQCAGLQLEIANAIGDLRWLFKMPLPLAF